jgi:hypothetical protein
MRRWHGAGFEEHPTSSAPWRALAWSPAGDRLLAERLPGAGGSGATGIFLASADGAELGELTPGPASAPDWALTGQIAFARSDVHVMRVGGVPRSRTAAG